jgi:hypothetical protein
VTIVTAEIIIGTTVITTRWICIQQCTMLRSSHHRHYLPGTSFSDTWRTRRTMVRVTNNVRMNERGMAVVSGSPRRVLLGIPHRRRGHTDSLDRT